MAKDKNTDKIIIEIKDRNEEKQVPATVRRPDAELERIPVRIERRRIKNMNMYIRPPYDEVLVTVPLRAHPSAVSAFIREKTGWMEKHLSRLRVSHAEKGERMPLTDAQKKALREHLDLVLPPLIKKWESRLNVHCAGYRLRVMKTCWGVCHCGKRTVTFNTMLGEKPYECVEYIVLHELCHLIEPNHGPCFYKLMDRFMPDWREQKSRLNEDIKNKNKLIKGAENEILS